MTEADALKFWRGFWKTYKETIMQLAESKENNVEVVRCKDCIYQGNYICKLINRNDSDNFYCADGERKENEQIHKCRGFEK